MPTNPDDIYYVAGKNAYAEGKTLADKPGIYLTNAWEYGFLDALAVDVRAMLKAQKT
jgi:hypothetical protein